MSSVRSNPVNILPMSDADYKNHKSVIVYLIDDPIVPGTNAPSLTSGKLFSASRPWIFGKRADSRDDAVAVGLGNAC